MSLTGKRSDRGIEFIDHVLGGTLLSFTVDPEQMYEMGIPVSPDGRRQRDGLERESKKILRKERNDPLPVPQCECLEG